MRPKAHPLPEGDAEQLIVKAFKKWCGENLPKGTKPRSEDALLFFLDIVKAAGGGGKVSDGGYSTIHRVLMAKGLIK